MSSARSSRKTVGERPRQSVTGGASTSGEAAKGRSYPTGNPVTDWAAAFVTHTLVPSVAMASGSSKL
jgi:hypothetical protein